MGRMYGRSVITGLARLDGWPVAILASDPYHYGGGWTADAAHKIARHLKNRKVGSGLWFYRGHSRWGLLHEWPAAGGVRYASPLEFGRAACRARVCQYV